MAASEIVCKIRFFQGEDHMTHKRLENGGLHVVRVESLEGRRLLAANPLDNSFGVGGRVVTPLGFEADSLRAVAVQADGKTVVVGTRASSEDARTLNFTVERFNVDGSIDTHFGDAGTATIAISNIENTEDDSASGLAVALQADGKIVVGGSDQPVIDGVLDLPTGVIARLNANGTEDASFGTEGQVLNSLNGDGSVQSIAIQADGKIVAAGSSDGSFAVFRCSADGTPDAHFGHAGLVTTHLGAKFGSSNAAAVAIQANNKILVAGSAQNSLAIERLNTAGVLDGTFGTAGKVLGSFGSGASEVRALAIDANGKILVGGSGGGRFAVARYLANGLPDGAFAGHGKVVSSFGGAGVVSGMSVTTGGKIVAAGTADGKFALARYNANGTLDASFGDGGRRVTAFSPKALAGGMSVGANGGIVIGGSRISGSESDFAIARYTSDGNLDATFHGTGRLVQNFHGVASSQSVALQKNGKVVVAGTAGEAGTIKLVLVRYNRNGSLDTTFGHLGKVSTGFGFFDERNVRMLVLGNGEMLVGTWLDQPQTIDNPLVAEVGLAKYRADGTLDTTFGRGGKLIIDAGGLSSAFERMAVDAQGKIVVTAENFNGGWVVLRRNANGTPDNSFGTKGRVVTLSGSVPSGLAITSGGKIIVGGEGTGTDNNPFRMVRYNHDGSVDNTFHPANATADKAFNKDFVPSNLVIGSDGKILVVGDRLTNPKSVLARYLANGAVDGTFGTAGKVVEDFNNVRAVVEGTGGSIVTAGTRTNSNFSTSLVVAKLNANGTPDATFGTAGEAVVPLTDFEEAQGLAVQDDGNVVIALSDAKQFEVLRVLG